MKSSLLFATLVAVLIATAGCGGGGGGGEVIAKVNGTTVTKEQYLKQLETMDTIAVQLSNGQVVNARPAQPLSAQALSGLIEKQVILDAAKKEGKMPSKDDVEKERALRTTLNPDFINLAKAMGLSIEDINRALMVELARYNLAVRGGPEKTIKDATDYVRDNPKQFEQPPMVSMRWIYVDTPDEQKKVDDDLKSGLTFGAVASKYSKVPNARANNGAFNSGDSPIPRPTPMNEATLGKELYQAASTTAPGAKSAWFKFQGKPVKIEVGSKTPATQVQPKPAQLELIRRALTEQDAKGTNNLGQLLLDTLMASDVQVIPAHLKKSWETMLTALKQRTAEMGAANSGIQGSQPKATAPKPAGQ